MSACRSGHPDFKFISPVLLGLMFVVICGCAVRPMAIHYPANHPANPMAVEAEFTPPPNPFQENLAGTEGGPAAPLTKPETSEESELHPPDPHGGAGGKTHPPSESTMPQQHIQGTDPHREPGR